MDPSIRLSAVIALALGVSACGDRYETERCLSVPNDGVCPTVAEARKELLGPGCGERTVSIDGEATIKQPPWAGWDTGGNVFDDMCCYPATAQTVRDGCVVGRPMRVDGELRTAGAVARSDWAAGLTPDLAGLTGDQRRILAQEWTRTAAGEHASIAAFSRLALELLRLGAPAELIADVHRAALDEVRHAEAAYGLASAYAGVPVGPGPVPLPAELPLARDHAAVAMSAAMEGCRDETLAALLAARAASAAVDPRVKSILEEVAADEARHAALSWRVLKWALQGCSAAVQDTVGGVLTAKAPEIDTGVADDPMLAAHGVLGRRATAACFRDGMRSVVHTSWQALVSNPV